MAGLLGFASGSVALLGFATGAAVLLSLAFLASRRGLHGLEVRRSLPPSAFEDDLLTVDLVIENHADRPARFVEAGDVFGAGPRRPAERPGAGTAAAAAPAHPLLPRFRGPPVGAVHGGAALRGLLGPAGPLPRRAAPSSAWSRSRSFRRRWRSRPSRPRGPVDAGPPRRDRGRRRPEPALPGSARVPGRRRRPPHPLAGDGTSRDPDGPRVRARPGADLHPVSRPRPAGAGRARTQVHARAPGARGGLAAVDRPPPG